MAAETKGEDLGLATRATPGGDSAAAGGGDIALVVDTGVKHADIRTCGLLDDVSAISPLWSPRDAAMALHVAAASGSVLVMCKLVDDGHVPIDAQDDDGHTALHLAASRNQVSTVRIALARGADPTARSISGRNPLHAAAASDAVSAVREILALCAPAGRQAKLVAAALLATDGDGFTPLQLAALVHAGAAFNLLVTHCDAETVCSAIRPSCMHADNVLITSTLAFVGQSPMTQIHCTGALHLAACWGGRHIVQALHTYGASVLVDEDGVLASVFAQRCSDPECSGFLAEQELLREGVLRSARCRCVRVSVTLCCRQPWMRITRGRMYARYAL